MICRGKTSFATEIGEHAKRSFTSIAYRLESNEVKNVGHGSSGPTIWNGTDKVETSVRRSSPVSPIHVALELL